MSSGHHAHQSSPRRYWKCWPGCLRDKWLNQLRVESSMNWGMGFVRIMVLEWHYANDGNYYRVTGHHWPLDWIPRKWSCLGMLYCCMQKVTLKLGMTEQNRYKHMNIQQHLLWLVNQSKHIPECYLCWSLRWLSRSWVANFVPTHSAVARLVTRKS